MAGTAVYMTSYPRTEEGREWEKTSHHDLGCIKPLKKF
jgi:hypothetical protein